MPDGDYRIEVADDYGRRTILRALATFMDWRQVVAFAFCTQLVEPDALLRRHLGQSPLCCVSRITRDPPVERGEFRACGVDAGGQH